MHEKSDKELVAAIQDGDIAAFELLVKRYQHGLISFAYRIVKDPHTAQDVVQDAFLKVYKAIDNVDTSKKISTFIFEVTKNTAISALRTQKHEVSLEDIVELGEDEHVYENLARSETRAMVRRAISSLDKKYQEILTLYYFDDLSYQEIQKRLHIPLNTVRTHLKRAKDQVKKILIYEKY